MICEACKRYIEKEIAYYQGKTVNCMGHGCKNGAQCSRRGLVKYCLELLCPKQEKKDDIHEAFQVIVKAVEEVRDERRTKDASSL